jgi:Flagellar biosynthesis protein, FliO
MRRDIGAAAPALAPHAAAIALALAALALALALPAAARAQDAPAASSPRPGSPAASRAVIPYKQDEDIGVSLGRLGVGLAIALGVGVAALVGWKRLVLPHAAGRRMRLVETLHLGPKAAVFLVEVDGKTLLIGQQGETLALLDAAPKVS